MSKPIVPRDWRTTKAVVSAKKPGLMLRPGVRGKPIPAFNGSQTSRRNRQRPITLPKIGH